MVVSRWTEVARDKTETRARLIAKYLQKANEELIVDEKIFKVNNIGDLTKLYVENTYSVKDVIKTYVQRAAEANEKTNCLTEILFDQAVAQAESLDNFYATHGRLVGPLHGVPMTLKDQFNVEGVDSTLGYVGRELWGCDPSKDEPTAEHHVVRNRQSPLGLTTNPLNPAYTPGGSTGGEGALLALQGTMVGWGTDIGGSIRIPSHINGLWGLKPTSSRLPYQGVPVSTEGQEHVPSSIGPLARGLASIITVMQCLLRDELWVLDPRVVPIPWRKDVFEEIQTRPLVIGVLLDDGVVKVHAPIERALKELSSKLADAGHELVPWNDSGHRECIEIMDLFYSADGGEDIRRDVQTGGEPFIPHVEALIERGPAISVYEYWQLNKRKLAAQKAYNDKWNSVVSPVTGRKVDVLLTPAMPHAAVPHRSCRWVGYTKVWNFLDYTALSFPAGKVEVAKDGRFPAPYQPRNEYDSWNWKLYNEAMDGHPVGLQIVGRRFEEEKVLGAAKVIEQLMNT